MSHYRRSRMLNLAVLAALLAASFLLPGGALAGVPNQTGTAEVGSAVQHDVSQPLGSIQVTPALRAAATPRTRPLQVIPPADTASVTDKSYNPDVTAGVVQDGAVQDAATSAVGTTAGLNFAGVGQGDYGYSDFYAPPDTEGAVGATQYVQWVNADFAIFNKSTGAILPGYPKPGNALWAGFGGGCETNNDGDPIVQYDKIAQRWVFTQMSVSSTPYLQCVAVSTSPDANGTYNRYAFNYGTAFPDYTKLGVWPDAYYITFNNFTNGSTWAGARVCAYDRASMLAGTAATQQCFQLSTNYSSLLPSDLDGTTLPPAGTPNYLVNFGTNSLNYWKFHVDWANSANSSLTGPTRLSVASFSAACSGGGTCIPQPGTTQRLDSLADRLMYRLAYRNRSGTQSLVVNHSVSVRGPWFSTISSVRWYELRIANGAASIYQQGTLSGSDGIYRWMGSIAMDKMGNIALGYSASSGSVRPSIRYTGRLASDSRGTMQSEKIIKAGGGSQTKGLSRWGDYSAMSIDPVDDCTFWYTNEYLKSSGIFNWSTWISSFKFPGCS